MGPDEAGRAEGDLAEHVAQALVGRGQGIAEGHVRAVDAVAGVGVDDHHVDGAVDGAAGHAAEEGVAGGVVLEALLGGEHLAAGDDLDVGGAGRTGRGEAGDLLGVVDRHRGHGQAVEGDDRAVVEVGAEAVDGDEGAARHRALAGSQVDGLVGVAARQHGGLLAQAQHDVGRTGVAGRGAHVDAPRVDELEVEGLDHAAVEEDRHRRREAVAADGGLGAAREGSEVGVEELDGEGGRRRTGVRVADAVGARRGVGRRRAAVGGGRRAAAGGQRAGRQKPHQPPLVRQCESLHRVLPSGSCPRRSIAYPAPRRAATGVASVTYSMMAAKEVEDEAIRGAPDRARERGRRPRRAAAGGRRGDHPLDGARRLPGSG